jgi:hypothetical protein
VLGKCQHQAFAADDKHRRAGRHGVGNKPGRRLGGGDDGVVVGGDAEVTQVLRHCRRRPGRVVGDEAQSAAGLDAPGQVVGRTRQGVWTCVDHAVEVEQQQVVLGAQRPRGRAQEPGDRTIGLHVRHPRMRR